MLFEKATLTRSTVRHSLRLTGLEALRDTSCLEEMFFPFDLPGPVVSVGYSGHRIYHRTVHCCAGWITDVKKQKGDNNEGRRRSDPAAGF